MLRNLVSIDDFLVVHEKLRQGYGGRVKRLLRPRSRNERTQMAWEATESPPKHWGSLDQVQKRWNKLATGNPDRTFHDHFVETYLFGTRNPEPGTRNPGLRALSIGCGTGTHEIRFAGFPEYFSRIDAYDVSPVRIALASKRARDIGLDDVLHFHAADVRTLELPPNTYDLLITINALHHIAPLEPAILRFKSALKQGGLILLRDYVGPRQFQWPDRQVRAVDEALKRIPESFRRRWGSGSVKKRVWKPGRLLMRLSDPSEAAESDLILPLLESHFTLTERRDLGGGILHLALKDIAHNFASAAGKPWLGYLFELEDQLLASGEVSSDFVVSVFKV
ncbi:MAG: class I SAM-dependent methyltransferase [Rhodothermia bacterium]